MSLVIKEKENEYPIPEEGIFDAVCVDVVDIGKVETPWGPKEKITLMFELDAQDEAGNRYVVGKRYTKSLNERSNLRADLSKWRNRKFKPRELSSGAEPS